MYGQRKCCRVRGKRAKSRRLGDSTGGSTGGGRDRSLFNDVPRKINGVVRLQCNAIASGHDATAAAEQHPMQTAASTLT